MKKTISPEIGFRATESDGNITAQQAIKARMGYYIQS
jgi:hypothetical protein